MLSMTEPNPVGTAQKQLLVDKIKQVVDSWTANNPTSGWLSRVRGAWVKAVAYILTATDYFIRAVDDVLDNGADKKATVIAALGEVYDKIVPGLMPIWLRPFNSKIKGFVMDVIVSLTVDFIVGKYRNGSWGVESPAEELPVETVEPAVE